MLVLRTRLLLSVVVVDKQTHPHDGVINKFNVAVAGAGRDAIMGVESEKGLSIQSCEKLVLWVATEKI